MRGPQEPSAGSGSPPRVRPTWRKSLRRDWQLYSLAVLPLLFFAVFRYLPMAGNVIAFRRFQPGGNIFGEQWVGLRYVEQFIGDPTFWRTFTNTLILGTLLLVVTFPLPIVLALLLNEVRTQLFKRFVQSVSLLPHFLSVVVVVAMVMQVVSINGAANNVLRAVGQEAIPFIQRPEWFRPIYVSSDVWQTIGFGTILYLAALTTIDPQLYDSARVDGASRWKQTWHVTLPGIRPTIVALLILNIGQFLAVGFEKVLLLQNPLTYSTGDVIATYLYRMGVVSNNFSYAAAIGMFEAVIGLTLVLSANFIARRTVRTSLW